MILIIFSLLGIIYFIYDHHKHKDEDDKIKKHIILFDFIGISIEVKNTKWWWIYEIADVVIVAILVITLFKGLKLF